MLCESQERENHRQQHSVFNGYLQCSHVIQGMSITKVAQIWVETLDQSDTVKKKVKGVYFPSSKVENLSLLLLLHPKELCNP